MLKRFFLNLASSFIGAWMALGLFVLVAVIVVISLVGKIGAQKVESVKKHSILTIKLNGNITETATNPEFNVFDLAQGDIQQAQALNVIVKSIEEAATNKDIDCIYLECEGAMGGPATLDAIRNALLDFKKTAKDKKIMAYGPLLTQGDYYLATAADSVFVNPQGEITLTGVYGSVPYMKGLFDKIGLEFQVVKVGTFKSAVEPYLMETMSEPARAQLDTLYGVMWNELSGAMAKSRNITQASIDTLISKDIICLNSLEVAKKAKLVDGTVYERQMMEKLARLTDCDVKDLNFVSPSLLAGSSNIFGDNPGSKNQIAVLYCVGEISEGTSNGINCFDIVPEILNLADDDNVKGLVMRVNSPGGSVFGSEQIWEAMQYFKSKGKPFAVSMGDYAASGGYYISCGADRIFANPLTVTGSIGIFGLFPNAAGLEEKLGVNFETTYTNKNGALLIPYKPLNEDQLAAAQAMVERGYEQFCKRVADGRNMSVDAVKRIAEGRVWAAPTAKEIGLVDELGQLGDAVSWVAGKAGIEDNYNLCGYPLPSDSFWKFIPQSAQTAMFRQFLGEQSEEILPHQAFGMLQYMLSRKPMQARMQPLILKL